MNILVVNCGSSSIKYQFIEADSRRTLAKGLVDRIGMSGALLTNMRYDEDAVKLTGEILDHAIAIEYVLAVLLSRNHGVIAEKTGGELAPELAAPLRHWADCARDQGRLGEAEASYRRALEIAERSEADDPGSVADVLVKPGTPVEAGELVVQME